VVWEAFEDYRLHALQLTRLETETIGRLAATGTPAPWGEEAFLAAQPSSWKDLTRSRERDECREKLRSLGLVARD
jgi:thymidylate synthase (FAD)